MVDTIVRITFVYFCFFFLFFSTFFVSFSFQCYSFCCFSFEILLLKFIIYFIFYFCIFLLQQTQQQHSNTGLHDILSQSGAMARTPARLPEDVTALADRDNIIKDREINKNAVSKTYHTLKDLISSKFKKDTNEVIDELNNVVVQQQIQSQNLNDYQQSQTAQQQQQPAPPQQQQTQQSQQPQQTTHLSDDHDYRSPYSAIPLHMRQIQGLNQSQPNILSGGGPILNGRNFSNESPRQMRAVSQPHLNVMANFEQQQQQQHNIHQHLDTIEHKNGDIVTDSDDGGFASRSMVRRPQTMYHLTQEQHQMPPIQPKPQHLLINQMHNSPQTFHKTINHNGGIIDANSIGHFQQAAQQQQHSKFVSPYSHQQQQQQHANGQQHYTVNSHLQQQQKLFPEGSINVIQQQQTQIKTEHQNVVNSAIVHVNQEYQHASFQNKSKEGENNATGNHIDRGITQKPLSTQTQQQVSANQQLPNVVTTTSNQSRQTDIPTATTVNELKQMPGSANSSDYDKSGNQSSNVDSGRGSAAYSSGRKIQADTESSDSPRRNGISVKTDDDSEWVDVVDAELRHILDPAMHGLSIRPDSTISGSVSSISPPLPPLSPDNSSYKPTKMSKEQQKQQEYGTDSYNRAARGPIGPSRAGWPGSTIHKYWQSRSSNKKHDTTLLKRHCKYAYIHLLNHRCLSITFLSYFHCIQCLEWTQIKHQIQRVQLI